MGINALRFQAKAVYRGHGQRTDVEDLEVSITAGTRAMGDKQTPRPTSFATPGAATSDNFSWAIGMGHRRNGLPPPQQAAGKAVGEPRQVRAH